MDSLTMVNEVANSDIFTLDDFFTQGDFDFIEPAIACNTHRTDVVADAGPFQGQLIVSYVTLINDLAIRDFFRNKLTPLFGDGFSFNLITKQTLHLPWDIHADYYRQRTPDGFDPWYNILIPLEDVDSRTIVFDQVTHDRDDFAHYKATHDQLSEPISLPLWERYLSMCWPEDRLYLSIKRIMPAQKRGQMQALPRWYFHSSDNWHVWYPGKSKSFIQLRLDRPCKTAQ